MLKRKLIYTAITRAKKLLIVISSQNIIDKMVNNIINPDPNKVKKI